MNELLKTIAALWNGEGKASPENSNESEEPMAARTDPARTATSRWISILILLAIVIGMGILFYRVMATFFVPLFMALLLTVMFRPLHLWFVRKFGGYRSASAGLTTLIVLAIVLAPLAWAATLAVKEGVQVVSNVDVADMEQRLERVRKTLGLNVKSAQDLGELETLLLDLSEADEGIAVEDQHGRLAEARQRLQAFQADLSEQERASLTIPIEMLEKILQPPSDKLVTQAAISDAMIHVAQIKQTLAGGPVNAWLTQQANPSEEKLRQWRQQSLAFAEKNFAAATGATTEFVGKLILGLIIMIVGLYFFLADGEVLLNLVSNLSPLDEVYERELLLEFDRVSRAVVLATILSALTQAVLAGIGFWLVGIDAVMLLMMLTFVLAMVPFVGAASVWVPVSLYLWLYNDQYGAAIFLAVYGGLIISLSDNVVKPLVLHGQSKLHPLLALLSILGGVQALGPLGIFIGPMVVAFLQTLLKLLHREIMALEASEKAEAADAGAGISSEGGEPPTKTAEE